MRLAAMCDLAQLVERILNVLGEVPDVGDQERIGEEAEIDVAHVTEHRDVEARTFHDRTHRIRGDEFGAREIQRERWSGNVGDDEVVDRAVHARQAHRRIQAGGHGERTRRCPFPPLGQHACTDRVVFRLRSLRRGGNRAEPLNRMVQMGRQRGEHGRNAVTAGAHLVLVANRDRTHRHQRRVRE